MSKYDTAGIEIVFWDFLDRSEDRPVMEYSAIGLVYDGLWVDEPKARTQLAQYESGTRADGSDDGWWILDEDGTRTGPYSDFIIKAVSP